MENKLLKTNSKEYIKNVEEYIFNCIDLTYFELNQEVTNKKDILQLVWNEIKSHSFYEYNLRRFKNNKIDVVADYLQGLPSYINIDFENWVILKVAAKLHNIDNIPENKEDIILNNWFIHMADKLIKLCIKHDVKM